MTVHRVVVSATRVYQSGEPVPVEIELIATGAATTHAEIDFCQFHAPEEEPCTSNP